VLFGLLWLLAAAALAGSGIGLPARPAWWPCFRVGGSRSWRLWAFDRKREGDFKGAITGRCSAYGNEARILTFYTD